MVYNFKEGDETKAKAEAHETPCIADKGGERDGNIPLGVGVVGILNKELNDCYIILGILVDKIVHPFIHVCLWWIHRIVNVAYLINLYYVLNVITGCEHFVLLLNDVRFVGIFATPVAIT